METTKNGEAPPADDNREWLHFFLPANGTMKHGLVIGWRNGAIAQNAGLQQLALKFPQHEIASVWLDADNVIGAHLDGGRNFRGETQLWQDVAPAILALLADANCRFVEDLAEPRLGIIYNAVRSMQAGRHWAVHTPQRKAVLTAG